MGVEAAEVASLDDTFVTKAAFPHNNLVKNP
jgi:hypothetical protein